jgi:peptidoglycan/xylan/chitin deacetylase (PgdA/CDA1 family)
VLINNKLFDIKMEEQNDASQKGWFMTHKGLIYKILRFISLTTLMFVLLAGVMLFVNVYLLVATEENVAVSELYPLPTRTPKLTSAPLPEEVSESAPGAIQESTSGEVLEFIPEFTLEPASVPLSERMSEPLPEPEQEELSERVSEPRSGQSPVVLSEIIVGRDNIDPSLPMVALTFDDGPSQHTTQILNLLERYGGRATFCVIGNMAESGREVLQRAVSMGNEVIGHSWDHKNMAKLSADNVRQQIMDTSDLIASVTGADPVFLFRPPYGELSDTMREVSAELGFAMVNWNVDPRDWDTKDADSVYHAVLGAVSDGSIILSHEIYRSTLDAYTRLIPELLSRGFQIVTVSELLYHRHGELTPGHVYYDGRVR